VRDLHSLALRLKGRAFPPRSKVASEQDNGKVVRVPTPARNGEKYPGVSRFGARPSSASASFVRSATTPSGVRFESGKGSGGKVCCGRPGTRRSILWPRSIASGNPRPWATGGRVFDEARGGALRSRWLETVRADSRTEIAFSSTPCIPAGLATAGVGTAHRRDPEGCEEGKKIHVKGTRLARFAGRTVSPPGSSEARDYLTLLCGQRRRLASRSIKSPPCSSAPIAVARNGAFAKQDWGSTTSRCSRKYHDVLFIPVVLIRRSMPSDQRRTTIPRDAKRARK